MPENCRWKVADMFSHITKVLQRTLLDIWLCCYSRALLRCPWFISQNFSFLRTKCTNVKCFFSYVVVVLWLLPAWVHHIDLTQVLVWMPFLTQPSHFIWAWDPTLKGTEFGPWQWEHGTRELKNVFFLQMWNLFVVEKKKLYVSGEKMLNCVLF